MATISQQELSLFTQKTARKNLIQYNQLDTVIEESNCLCQPFGTKKIDMQRSNKKRENEDIKQLDDSVVFNSSNSFLSPRVEKFKTEEGRT